ncbi:furin-like protease 2 [Bacillus rossius redtenbacheri]|uniref:furin-like protease 2 n=1 Tax=Bacillus rossius redtenbacheri TaxID=93214 RepID=UPI002FDD9669
MMRRSSLLCPLLLAALLGRGLAAASPDATAVNAGRPTSEATTETSDPVQRMRTAPTMPDMSDPLFKDQWYLNGGAKGGLDMNVVPAWRKGYSGKGVVVSILDDGIQTNHPDLALNYDRLASTDINDNDDDPTPRDDGDNKHGTRCAGEVAGIAFNSICGVGVAYNASIGGVRMLDGTVNDAVEARALGLNPDHIDIYSASWGPEDDGKTVDGPGPLARRAFIYGVTKGRKGKGSIFVWASGNGGNHMDSCNCDGYTNSIFTLSISSVTQAGSKPWYLEECSSTLATTYSSGTPGRDRSVATADMDPQLRPERLCTVDHTGTSASAPLAAGIVALALEANPRLTWRDVQYLVVLASRSAPLRGEPGWAVNGVGREVSHKFGYGLMDAAAMVTLAEKWTSVPPQHICKSQEVNKDMPISAAPGSTLTVHMDADGCSGNLNEVAFLEHVQCKVSLRFSPRGNLRILLTSPAGTTSVLLSERPRDVVSSSFDEWLFLSVHYWGERPGGRWTLQVVNSGKKRAADQGLLKKWQLIFYGTAVNPLRLKANESVDSWRSAEAAGPLSNEVDTSGPARKKGPSYKKTLQLAGRSSALPEGGCHAECDQRGCLGRGPSRCLGCLHYKLDNTCVRRCPPRSFPNQEGRCWPCHESCETCAGPGQDSCVTCAPAHLLLSDLATCLQQCPEGYYESYEQDSCIPCEPNCASCEHRNCTRCDHHLFLYNNKCYATCPQFTYETGDHRCADCHAACQTCSGPGAAQCVSCRAGHFALEGGCLAACPRGLFGHAERRECLPCPRGCSACAAGSCEDCRPGWVPAALGRCAPLHADSCSPGEFWSELGGCSACHGSCAACDGPAADRCLGCSLPLRLQGSRCLAACSRGFYPERGGGCLPCPRTCAACSSRRNCTRCKAGLRLQTGECRAACAPGYYSDGGLCAKCHLSCTTCSGPRRDQCVRCPDGWQLAEGECQPECPAGFFAARAGCRRCHHYCRTCCGAGPLNCTGCRDDLALDGAACVPCPAGRYLDRALQACLPCAAGCRACRGEGPRNCTECAPPLALDPAAGRCRPCAGGHAANKKPLT